MYEDHQAIKQKNSDNVYALFFKQDVVSKPQIGKTLGLSNPTVIANVAALLDAGLIKKASTFASQGGRPAVGYSLVSDAKTAVGVEIRRHHLCIAEVDLKGCIIKSARHRLNCAASAEYAEELVKKVSEFIESLPRGRLLGVGISFQGIIDADHAKIIYSKIIPQVELDPAVLSQRFNLPVRLWHDVDCAAMAELWHNKSELDNLIYVSVSEHLGGVLVANHHIEHGKTGYAGALEHMQLYENGRACYCGRQGCLETYCSLAALTGEYGSGEGESRTPESAAGFFAKLPEDPKRQALFSKFLSDFAKGLYPVYLLLERDIVIGGDLASYIGEKEIAFLEDQIIKRSSFTVEKGFIQVAQVKTNAALTGAALPFIAEVLPAEVIPVF